MSNAATALGILTGGGSGSSSTVSAAVAFKYFRQNEVAVRRQFADRADVQREIDYVKRQSTKIESADDLVKNRRVLSFVLSAFGLEAEVNNPGKIKAILKSDPEDPNSYANRLTDARFGQLAKFFDPAEGGISRLTKGTAQGELTDKFLTNEFEKAQGQQNPALREALFFLRRINDVNSTYEILSDLPLRGIVTNALGLPPEIARQSVERQKALVDAKFDLSKIKLGTIDGVTKTAADLLNDDINAVTTARGQVNAALNQITSIQTQIESLRSRLSDLPNLAGANAGELSFQDDALPGLTRQAGLISAANQAIGEADPLVKELGGLFAKLSAATDQDTLDILKSEFATLSNKLLGDSGIINSSTYTDPNSGPPEVTESLRRAGGDAGAGIDALPNSKIATEIKSDGTAVATAGVDLASFLTDLTSARDQVNALTLGGLSAGVSAAETTFKTARTDFDTAKLQNGVNVSSFTGSTKLVGFANPLDTQELARGISSVDDALSRVASVQTLLSEISSLANEASKPGADIADLDEQYQIKRAALKAAINTAGTVSKDGVSVSFDNLLTSGPLDYVAKSDTTLRANGGTLYDDLFGPTDDGSLLPTTLDASNAEALKAAVTDTYRPAADQVARDLKRDRTVFDFTANVADPQGAIDAELRGLLSKLDETIAKAKKDDRNLLSPFQSDFKVALGSIATTLTISSQSGFKDNFETALDGYAYTAVTGGAAADRTSLLNDALFAVSSAVSRLRGTDYALNIQSTILNQKKGDTGSSEGDFFKPLKATSAAIKFIESYLIKKDTEAAGGSFTASKTAYQAQLVGLVQPIAGGSGLNLNLLS